MNTLSSILLQSQQSGLSSMLMIVAMIAIFYFVMIRPQSKKQKEPAKAKHLPNNFTKERYIFPNISKCAAVMRRTFF